MSASRAVTAVGLCLVLLGLVADPVIRAGKQLARDRALQRYERWRSKLAGPSETGRLLIIYRVGYHARPGMVQLDPDGEPDERGSGDRGRNQCSAVKQRRFDVVEHHANVEFWLRRNRLRPPRPARARLPARIESVAGDRK